MTENLVSPSRPPPIFDELDASLIQATLQGNPSSFNELIQRHQPAIFMIVHRHLRHREEAEDAVQQVFLKAYQHLRKFRGDSKFFTWLYTIALNVVRNHVRQRKIRRMESLDVSGKTDESMGRQWPDKMPLPEEIVHHRWELERVRVAVENLIEPHRTIFMLHYFKHLSLNEVSVQIGRPVGTVKVYLHRARKMAFGLLKEKKNNV